jgi:uncharacterized protein (DUF2267 family)
MPSVTVTVYDGALRTAHEWLSDVAEELGTSDGHAASRALRAWLHQLRDRLPVASAVDFAAQLPEIVRGVFYEGWRPGRVPVKFGEAEYCLRFAEEALVAPEEVPAVAAAVAAVLRRRVGQEFVGVLMLIPPRLRALMGGQAAESTGEATAEARAEATVSAPDAADGRRGDGYPDPHTEEAQLAALEQRLEVLTQALRAFIAGLQVPPQAARQPDIAGAARRAHEILLAAAGPTAGPAPARCNGE